MALALAVALAWLLHISLEIMGEAGASQDQPADAIVVFGAAEYIGRPSPVYRARLEHAYDLFERGLAPVIVTTGGAGKDPHFSEGQVGRDYLEARGIPDANLIAETQGGDTDESARRVAVIMRANDLRSCLLVSDAYHMFRAKRMMAAQGIAVYSSPRPGSIPRTALGRYLAALRESFSYLLYKAHVR
ncbi:MAG TPA: YdcF family protein [Candidatus Binatia bacterium]|nr:YdcF family protein [Candidatus Binatia bacterium]